MVNSIICLMLCWLTLCCPLSPSWVKYFPTLVCRHYISPRFGTYWLFLLQWMIIIMVAKCWFSSYIILSTFFSWPSNIPFFSFIILYNYELGGSCFIYWLMIHHSLIDSHEQIWPIRVILTQVVWTESSAWGNKTSSLQMGPHETVKQRKHWNEETAHRMGKHPHQLYTWQETSVWDRHRISKTKHRENEHLRENMSCRTE